MAVYSHLPKWLQGRTVSGEFRPFTHEERQVRIRDFKAGIRLLRRFGEGFSPSEGYDLREPLKIHPSRITKARRDMKVIREQMARPHKIVRRPKKKESISALQKHTGQRIPKSRKLAVVQVPVPDRTKVHVRKGAVRVERELSDGRMIRERYFYLSRKFKTFNEIADWFEGNMSAWPKGFYGLMQSAHGQIWNTVQKELWPNQLRQYWTGYDERDMQNESLPRFASTVVGFRWIASTLTQTQKEMRQRETMLQIARRLTRERRASERSGRLTGRRGRIK